MKKHAILLALAFALFLAPAARADVLSSGAASWNPWVTPTQSAGVFWDTVSKDGTNCNVGFWVSGTGNCSAPISGFYTNSPNTTGSFLGDGSQGFLMTRDPATVMSAMAGVGVSALSATTEFGWFAANDPTTLNPLITGSQFGTSVQFSVPSGDYGFYLHVIDPRPDAVTPDTTFFSNTSDGYGSGRTHFAAFDLGNGTYALGIEDKQGKSDDPTWSDYDYNDFVVILSSTPVPEPATLLLLGTGLIGVAAVVRRRRKV